MTSLAQATGPTTGGPAPPISKTEEEDATMTSLTQMPVYLNPVTEEGPPLIPWLQRDVFTPQMNAKDCLSMKRSPKSDFMTQVFCKYPAQPGQPEVTRLLQELLIETPWLPCLYPKVDKFKEKSKKRCLVVDLRDLENPMFPEVRAFQQMCLQIDSVVKRSLTSLSPPEAFTVYQKPEVFTGDEKDDDDEEKEVPISTRDLNFNGLIRPVKVDSDGVSPPTLALKWFPGACQFVKVKENHKVEDVSSIVDEIDFTKKMVKARFVVDGWWNWKSDNNAEKKMKNSLWPLLSPKHVQVRDFSPEDQKKHFEARTPHGSGGNSVMAPQLTTLMPGQFSDPYGEAGRKRQRVS